MASAADVLKQLHKDHGKEIAVLGALFTDVPRLPTGVFAVDLASGGGFPMGKVSIVYGPESSGKTNIVLLAIAQGQQLHPDKFAVFVDAENSYDPSWAEQLGVDNSRVILVNPDYAEQAVDIIEGFLYADDVFVVALDSVAALVTNNEVNSSAEKAVVGGASLTVGKLARKAVRAFMASKKKNNGFAPALICINQIRLKIGCFDYNSPVWLADGTTMKIGAIVTGKHPVEVWSDGGDGFLVPRKVTGWADNGIGEPDEWLRIIVAGGNNGRRQMRVTKGHSIFTPSGEVLAGDLEVGDLVTTEGIQYYTEEQHEVVLGSILGDGSLRFEKGSTRGHLRVGHGLKQLDYAKYKASLFGENVLVGSNSVEFTTSRSLEFQRYSDIGKAKGLTHVPQNHVDQLTLRALAIWYMDDGTYGGSSSKWGWGKPSISTKILDLDSLSRLAKKIRSLGAGMPSIKVGKGLLWSGVQARQFMLAISPFVPSCMSYKVKDGLDIGSSLSVSTMAPVRKTFSEPVVSIEEGLSPRRKYDLTVEGEHNYFVNGVKVHNTMFGDPECLHADTLVNFVDGRSIPIRQVVEQKIDAPIWAFNEDTQQFFESRILSHHYNGEAKDGDFLTVSAQGVDTKNGVFSATVSYTHKFLTADGWLRAKELTVGTQLLTKYRSVISGTLAKFLSGSLVGDATVTTANTGLNSGLRYQDKNNPAYASWKAGLLSKFFPVSEHSGRHVVSPSYDIGAFSTPYVGRNPLAFFNEFSWLGMAVWLMDDGYYDQGHKRYTLSIKRYKGSPTMQKAISDRLNDLGLTHKWNSGAVVFTVGASNKLAQNCAEYFPSCMAYKLPEGLGYHGDALELHNDGVKYLPTHTPVTSVVPASSRKYRQRGLYDLHIEGHHNYLAGNMDNGFVVHNTMPGGNALKFASGFTMRIYGKNVVDKKLNETMPAYKETSIILKKWKMPILAINSTYNMLMLNVGGKKAGHVDDWNTISNYLKSLEYLDKGPKGKGWIMFGETYPTLDACKEHLYGDHTLLHNTKQTIIKELMGQGAIEPQTEEIDDEVLESL